MPYIKGKDREKFGDLLEKIGQAEVKTAGELNFLITKLMIHYIDVKGESYQTYNDLMGALRGAELELYRRQISDYEDEKIDSNGDVY